MRDLKELLALLLILCLAVSLCIKPESKEVYADSSEHVKAVELTTKSLVKIDDVFGEYMTDVDENIYYSLASVNGNTLVDLFGNVDTKMFEMAKKTINPCMALATTWGESGYSAKGISLTTVMDFDPKTYVEEIDWLTVTSNLEQVDSAWYLANTKTNYNINTEGKAYHMPNNLLQAPIKGSRKTSAMVGLGVGPYQATSTNWDYWDLDGRVNPVWGFRNTLEKCCYSCLKCNIDPISDFTVYAAMSLSHQGGSLINYDFGKKLINLMNTPNVQDAFNTVGYNMFLDAKERARKGPISLVNIDAKAYVKQVEELAGVDFSDYTGGPGRTNKGDYTATHCLRYVFYKYYFTSGL